MRHIKIFSPGRTQRGWLQEALDEYEKRLSPLMRIDWHLVKDDPSLTKTLEKQSAYYCLDPNGKSYTSETFSTFVHAHQPLVFVIGGALGLTEEIKARSKGLISFSQLTFTHQHMRLILLEQLYRASEIQRGSNYHK